MFSHLYKEYIIFTITRDESLVQVSGTNIFVYLNEKLGKLQTAFYEGRAETVEDEATKAKNEAAKEARKKNILSHKYNIKNDKDDYNNNLGKGFLEDIVNRNRLFYCAHMNRKNAFFKKHILNTKGETESEITQKIMTQIFGFTRVRKSVMEQCTKIISHVVHSQKNFDYNYYLTKNCPLQSNWKERKAKYL
jgi:hypothetical protein